MAQQHYKGTFWSVLNIEVPLCTIKNILQDLAKTSQDLARNLFQIHANFQESFLPYKLLVPNPCENLVFHFLAKILFKILTRFFHRGVCVCVCVCVHVEAIVHYNK